MAAKVNQDDFNDEVLKSDLPVLVDFYAEWCGPCKMMSPIIDKLSSEYEGKWKIFKCDVDECPELAEKYSVVSIPTLKVFKGGEVVDEKTGFASEEELRAMMGE